MFCGWRVRGSLVVVAVAMVVAQSVCPVCGVCVWGERRVGLDFFLAHMPFWLDTSGYLMAPIGWGSRSAHPSPLVVSQCQAQSAWRDTLKRLPGESILWSDFASFFASRYTTFKVRG